MKKIAFLMMAFVAACSLTACNDSDSSDPIYTDFATVVGSSPYTLYTDDGETLKVASDLTGSFTPDFGQRTLLYYNLLQSATGTTSTDKLVAVQAYYLFEMAHSIIKTADDETDYGSYDIDLYRMQGQYYLVHTSKNYIDLAIMLPAKGDMSKHAFSLVLDEQNPYDEHNRLKVRLCHDAEEGEADDSASIEAWFVSFDMSEFSDYVEGTAGITIVAPGINSNNDVTHSFDWI